jgi:hypothetical protein
MNNDALMLRQQQLLIRSAQLRMSFTEQTQLLKRPLAIADDARAGMQWLMRNPQWPLGVFVFAIVLRPTRALRWGARAWWAWKTVQRAQSWLANRPTVR